MLYERLKNDRLVARKSRSMKDVLILSTLIGECDRKAKEPTDDVVIKVIETTLDAIKLRKEYIGDMSLEEQGNLQREYDKLVAYLPQKLTASQVVDKIQEMMLFNHEITLGQIMAALKANYPGQYDAQHAAEIAKTLLKKV